METFKTKVRLIRFLSIILLFCLTLANTGTVNAQCSGCTSTITTNSSNVTVAAGQVVCITANNFSKNITITGGTLCIGSGTNISGGNFTVSGTTIINNYGTISHAIIIPPNCTFNNYGTISSGFTQTGGTFTNYSGAYFAPSAYTPTAGTFVNSAGASADIDNAAVTFGNGYNFTNNGTITAAKLTINSGATVTLNGPTQTLSNSIANNGIFTYDGPGTIPSMTEASGATTNFSSGVTISGTFSNSGTVNLDGSLTIGGLYSDAGTSVIKETGAGCNALTLSGGYLTNLGSFNGNNTAFQVTPTPICTVCLINGAYGGAGAAPTTQPTSFSSSISGLVVSGSFTAATSPKNGYIVLRSIGSITPVCNPVNGTTYTVGNTIGTCTVAAIITDATAGTKNFTDNVPGANCGSTIYYRVFHFQGCGSTIKFNVTSPLSGNIVFGAAPTASISGTNVTCNGGSNGAANLTPAGGTSPYTYLWNTGATSQDLTSKTTGTYNVTVTDHRLCTATATVTLTQPAAITITNSTSYTSCGWCSDGSINITVNNSVGALTYAWSNGATSQDISGLDNEDYTVTVTDSRGCTATSTITVATPLDAIIQGLSNCGGNGSATATGDGGTPPYTYKWNTGSTAQSLSNLVSGAYSVTVTDANNFTASQTVNIQNVNYNVTVTPSSAGWCTGSGGSVQLHASGAPNYLWTPTTGLSNAAIANPIATPTTTTTYTLTYSQITGDLVTNGDFSMGNVGFVSDYGYISPTANVASGNTGLYPEGYYAVDTNANNYHSPNWLGNDHTNGRGKFMIINGATIAGVTMWSQTIAVVSPNTNYNFSTWVMNCNTYNPAVLRFSINGVVLGPVITASDVQGVWTQFTATWNSGTDSNAVISILNDNTVAGGNDFGLDDITFTMTCTPVAGTVTVTVNPLPVPTATPTAITCNGAGNGKETLTVASGTSPFTYKWNNTATTQNLINLGVGTYTVTVTDNKTCTATASSAITQPAVLTASVSGTNATCNAGSDGAANLTPAGGNTPYTYAWTNGATTQDLNGVIAGTYGLTVTDSKGCTATATTTLTQPAPVTTASAGTDINQCNTAAFTMAANAPAVGTGAWSIVSGTPTIANTALRNTTVTLPAGQTATLRWTISNGACPLTSSDVVTITNSVAVTVSNAGPNQAHCNSASFTMAANTPVTGTGLWSVVSGSATINTPTSPTSTVTVLSGQTANLAWTITNGACSSADNVTVTNGAPPAAPLSQPTALVFSMTGLTVNGNFNAPASLTNVDGYIVLRSVAVSSPATSNPANNTNYTAGNTIGLWTVVAVISDATSGTKSFTDVLPTANCGKSAYYRVYTYHTNGTCIAYNTTSPLAGSIAFNPVYSWNKSVRADYTIAANWSPARSTSQTCDVLSVDNNNTDTLYNVPATENVAQLNIINSSTAVFQLAGASTVYTFSNSGTSTGLNIESGSTLDAGSALQFAFGATSMSAQINGNFRTADPQGLSGSTTTAFSSTNSPAITLGANSTITYNASTGTQVVTSRNDYSNITFANAATKNFAGNVTTTGSNDTVTITGGVVDALTYSLSEGSATMLNMTGGTLRFAKLVTTLPELTGNYNLSAGTIELYGSGAQVLRGAQTYYNLLFSVSGTTTLSADIATGTNEINGNVSITGSAILDVASYQFGSPATTFTMSGGKFRTSYTGATVPMMGGTYALSAGTVELYGTACTDSQTLRSSVTYYNVNITATASSFTNGNVKQATGTVTIASGATLTISSPAIYTIDASSVISGAGTFTMTSGSGLYYGSANGITPASCGTGSTCGNIRTTNRTYLTGTSGYTWPL